MKEASQYEKLKDLLENYEERSTIEICEKVYGGSLLRLARVAARIYDIKQKEGWTIIGFERDGKFYYQRVSESRDEDLMKKYPDLYVSQKKVGTMQISMF